MAAIRGTTPRCAKMCRCLMFGSAIIFLLTTVSGQAGDRPVPPEKPVASKFLVQPPAAPAGPNRPVAPRQPKQSGQEQRMFSIPPMQSIQRPVPPVPPVGKGSPGNS